MNQAKERREKITTYLLMYNDNYNNKTQTNRFVRDWANENLLETYVKDKLEFDTNMINIIFKRGVAVKKTEKEKYQNFIVELIANNCNVGDLITAINDENRCKYFFSNKYLYNIASVLIKNLNLELKTDHMIISIINNNLDMVEFLLKKKLSLTQKHLEIACKYSDDETIHFLLNYKLYPNQKCFNNILLNIKKNNEIYNEINNEGNNERNNERNKYGFHEGIYIDDEPKLFLIMNYGYKITQKDFENLTKNKIYIKDYKNFINDKVKKICKMTYFFPYQEIQFENDLDYIFNGNFNEKFSIKHIKNIIETFGCKLKLKHLKSALKYSNDYNILQFLIVNCGVIPDEKCLCIAIENYNDIKFVKLIYNNIDKKKLKENVQFDDSDDCYDSYDSDSEKEHMEENIENMNYDDFLVHV